MSFKSALCAAVIGGAALASSAQAQDAAADPAEAKAQAALEQAKDAFTDASAAPQRDLTLALIKLSQAIPNLEGADKRAANRLLARPDDGPNDRYGDGFTTAEAPESPACADIFCVHWVDTSKDKPDAEDSNGTDDGDGVPDYVEEVLASADDSYSEENTNLGWTDPVGDDDRGEHPPSMATDRTDIYLLDIDKLYYGYASPDEGQGPDPSKWAYLVLDNDYKRLASPPEFTAVEAMQVTMAHEYNHVLQFAYDSQQDLWMFESTATWMENVVYPSIDDYLGYLPFYARASQVPLTGNTKDGLKIYGAAVWNHYLAADNPAIVRDAWADSLTTDHPHLSAAAYDAAMGGTGVPYITLSNAFAVFALDSAEWRRSSDVYEDATEFPDIKRKGKLKPGDTRKVKLDHLSYVLLDVPVNAAADGFGIKVKGPDDTYTSMAVVGRTGDAETGLVTTAQSTGGSGDGTVGITAGAYQRATAMIANADADVNGAGTKYARENEKYKIKLTAGP